MNDEHMDLETLDFKDMIPKNKELEMNDTIPDMHLPGRNLDLYRVDTLSLNNMPPLQVATHYPSSLQNVYSADAILNDDAVISNVSNECMQKIKDLIKEDLISFCLNQA